MNVKLENVKIAIIGLGYVGLPLAIEFGKKYHVLGYDINTQRIKELQSGLDHTQEADLEGMKKATNLNMTNSGLGLAFSSKEDDLKD